MSDRFQYGLQKSAICFGRSLGSGPTADLVSSEHVWLRLSPSISRFSLIIVYMYFFARRAIVFARYSLRTRKWCVNRVCVCLCLSVSVCWCRQIAKKLGFRLVWYTYLRCKIQEVGSAWHKTKTRIVHNSGFEQIASEFKNNPRLRFDFELVVSFESKIVSGRPVSLPIWTQ